MIVKYLRILLLCSYLIVLFLIIIIVLLLPYSIVQRADLAKVWLFEKRSSSLLHLEWSFSLLLNTICGRQYINGIDITEMDSKKLLASWPKILSTGFQKKWKIQFIRLWIASKKYAIKYIGITLFSLFKIEMLCYCNDNNVL